MNGMTEVFPERDAFRAWLAAHAPSDVVGVPCFSTRCPLALYLRLHGAAFASVDPTAGTWTTDPNSWSPDTLPAWAEIFGHDVDSLPDEIVTARVALRLLDDALVAGPTGFDALRDTEAARVLGERGEAS